MALLLGGGALLSGINPALAARLPRNATPAWAAEPMRWFQLAFTEDDPGRFNPAFWTDYFRDVHADGVCLSAGGGIAFYPTDIPYHGMATGVGRGAIRSAQWSQRARRWACACSPASIPMR